MSASVPESSSPHAEPQMAARRKRIAGLALIVFELMKERYQGGINHEYDGVESADLIAALRVCSSYTDQISCLPPDDPWDPFVIEIQGVDGHNYIIQFSLAGPGIFVHAARVRVTNLSLLAGPKDQEDSRNTTFAILQDYSERLKLGKVTADQAFLIGISLIIGFIDQEREERNEGLDSLLKLITLRREELRQIRSKLPLSTTNYDEEGDQPF